MVLIRQCPRFAHARAAHLTPIAPDLSPSTLFGSKALLDFLEVTKACFKPLEEAPTQVTAVITQCHHPPRSPVTKTKNFLFCTMYKPHI
jgi:hypothetical protein